MMSINQTLAVVFGVIMCCLVFVSLTLLMVASIKDKDYSKFIMLFAGSALLVSLLGTMIFLICLK